MGGFFGAALKKDCVFDLFFGTDYHSHLGTRRAGMAVYSEERGFDRAIHNIENAPFRTKFDKDVNEMQGNLGIGCISDYEPQPLLVRSHHGTYAIMTVGKINNTEEIVKEIFSMGHSHFLEMSGGDINATELVAAIIAKFGADARFHTCSAADMDAAELVAFFEAKGKFRPTENGFTMDRGKVCKDY